MLVPVDTTAAHDALDTLREGSGWSADAEGHLNRLALDLLDVIEDAIHRLEDALDNDEPASWFVRGLRSLADEIDND